MPPPLPPPAAAASALSLLCTIHMPSMISAFGTTAPFLTHMHALYPNPMAHPDLPPNWDDDIKASMLLFRLESG